MTSVASDRARQGLPLTVEDPDVLARVAAILRRSAPSRDRSSDGRASKPIAEVAR